MIVASVRNQSTIIRLRGAFIDEKKRKTKSTGNSAWIASPEPGAQRHERADHPEARADERREDEQDERAEHAGLDVDAEDQRQQR